MGDHPNCGIFKAGQNTEKTPEDTRKCCHSNSSKKKNNQLKLVRKNLQRVNDTNRCCAGNGLHMFGKWAGNDGSIAKVGQNTQKSPGD